MGFHWLVCFEVKMYFEYLIKNDDISHLTNSWCTQNFKTKLELKECTYKKSTTYLIQKIYIWQRSGNKSEKKIRKRNNKKKFSLTMSVFFFSKSSAILNFICTKKSEETQRNILLAESFHVY